MLAKTHILNLIQLIFEPNLISHDIPRITSQDKNDIAINWSYTIGPLVSFICSFIAIQDITTLPLASQTLRGSSYTLNLCKSLLTTYSRI